MSFSFQKLQATHLIPYRNIRLEGLKNYPINFGATYKQQSQLPQLLFEKHITEQTPGKFIIGAFDAHKLIGICGFVQEQQARTKHRGTIIQMYVQPSYQGQKVGLNLLKATLKEAFKIPELEQIVLDVITINMAANKVYEQVGFKEYGLYPKYYKIEHTYVDLRLMVLNR